MLFLSRALAFLFDNPLGKMLGAAAIVFGLVAGFAAQQRSVGATKAVQKIERANHEAAKAGGRAAARAVSPGVRGERDPSTRND